MSPVPDGNNKNMYFVYVLSLIYQAGWEFTSEAVDFLDRVFPTF